MVDIRVSTKTGGNVCVWEKKNERGCVELFKSQKIDGCRHTHARTHSVQNSPRCWKATPYLFPCQEILMFLYSVMWPVESLMIHYLYWFGSWTDTSMNQEFNILSRTGGRTHPSMTLSPHAWLLKSFCWLAVFCSAYYNYSNLRRLRRLVCLLYHKSLFIESNGISQNWIFHCAFSFPLFWNFVYPCCHRIIT